LIQLHNSLAQKPLSFTRKRAKVLNATSTQPLGNQISGWQTDRYLIGYNWSTMLRTREVLIDTLPSAFDLKVLFGLIGLLGNSTELYFKSMYECLKRLNLPTSAHYYQRTDAALFRWLCCVLEYRDAYYDTRLKRRKRVEFFNVISGYSLEGSQQQPLEAQALSVNFTREFYRNIRGNYTAFIDLNVVEHLDGTAAIELYKYLCSFDLKLSTGTALVRNVAMLGTNLLGMENSRTHKKWQAIENAVKQINDCLTTPVYAVVRRGKNVIFSKLS